MNRPGKIAAEGTSGSAPETRTPAGLSGSFPEEYRAAETTDLRDEVIRRHFDLRPVNAERDIRPETLYYLRAKESGLIRTSRWEPGTDPIPLTVEPSGRRMKAVSREKLLELGRREQLFRLVPIPASEQTIEEGGPIGDPQGGGDDPEASAGRRKSHAECVIDMGSFTQLLTAARQSGIVPNADQIAHVRDRDFRMGRYQTAFSTIERLSVRLTQESLQRQQRLHREEIQYKSGTLKMSPKQWQLKKQRDTLQTQKIERARRHFSRVLDGLRVVLASPEAQGPTPG